MTVFQKQKAFMQAFDMKVADTIQSNPEAALLWSRLIAEEFTEMSEAYEQFADDQNEETAANLTAELVDCLYVLLGFANSQGLPVEAMFEEIHEANMRKLVDGKAVRNEFGKILKPEGWTPANKVGVIRRATEKEVGNA